MEYVTIPLSRALVPVSACLLCVSLVACGSASGTQPKLLVITPNPSITAPPLPRFNAPCDAPPESGKPRSHVVFSGPCHFTETAAVRCIRQGDDFYIYIHRKFAHGWTFDANLNVEHYSGPDTYTNLTDVYIQLSKGESVDAWGQHQATATVTEGEHSLILQLTTAPGYAGTLQVEPELMSGTFVCRSDGSKG
jgi:hypothetical protein